MKLQPEKEIPEHLQSTLLLMLREDSEGA